MPKNILLVIIFSMSFIAKSAYGQQTPSLKGRLNIPFGTLVKMKVEIVDGAELDNKGFQSSFLFRIKSIDSVILSDSIIVEFKDETGHFPNDEFLLHKYLSGKKTGTISSEKSEEMKKKYVGKEYNIVAYETGEYTGVPDGYFKYQPVRQDYGFHFRHYVIVVADLSKKQSN